MMLKVPDSISENKPSPPDASLHRSRAIWCSDPDLYGRLMQHVEATLKSAAHLLS